MKRLIFYRIIVIALVIDLLFSFNEYKNKECTQVVKKEILNPNYVFLGDSITDYYNLDKYYDENIPIVNSGIDGNRVEDILDNLDKRVFRYNPSKVILLIGVNNLLGGDTEDIVVGKITELTDKISNKLPNCKIYIESIYPTNNDEWKKKNKYVIDEEKMKERIKNVNVQLKKLCEKNNYNYVNVYKILKTEDDLINEKYTDDGLHPNEKGYEKITEELKKVLNL